LVKIAAQLMREFLILAQLGEISCAVKSLALCLSNAQIAAPHCER
jgi:hypothetical protein